MTQGSPLSFSAADSLADAVTRRPARSLENCRREASSLASLSSTSGCLISASVARAAMGLSRMIGKSRGSRPSRTASAR